MIDANEKRWQELMVRLRLPSFADVFADLIAAYSEPHRYYHTIAHISDCLSRMDAVAEMISEPDEVELALWFHDAIYRIGSNSNEADSADWAQTFLCSAGFDAGRSGRVYDLIMATDHSDATEAECWIVDIDLAILGAGTDAYAEYCQAIRKEYVEIPDSFYVPNRCELLASFLAKPRIFRTGHFYDLYEKQARQNIGNEISLLAC